jgi:hypothetical protein
MAMAKTDDRGLAPALMGDGRPLLSLTGLSLGLSGIFACFQSATGQFLPHDATFLGMTAQELCVMHECRIVHFMIHDRVAFGGALIAIGALYLWLAEFPLRRRQAWAWWVLAGSGLIGFGSFLAYLGYGYLDTWHGTATLALFPCFLLGLGRSFGTLHAPRGVKCLLRPGAPLRWTTAYSVGRACFLAVAAGMCIGGLTILTVGMTCVFVPQDLQFMGLSVADLNRINPRLVPLIAHDRAGFGGGVCVSGLVLASCVWCGAPSRSLWQVLALAGLVGFSAAIGIHPAVGYTSLTHLAPAILGAVVYLCGLLLTFSAMHAGGETVRVAHATDASCLPSRP